MKMVLHWIILTINMANSNGMENDKISILLQISILAWPQQHPTNYVCCFALYLSEHVLVYLVEHSHWNPPYFHLVHSETMKDINEMSRS